MSTPSPVADWKEVRNQELSEVITRRVQAGLFTSGLLADLIKSSAATLLLPPKQDGSSSQLAALLEEWLDERLMTPEYLPRMLRRWQEGGLVAREAPSLTEADCGAVLQKMAFQRLVAAVRTRDLEEEVGSLPDDLLGELESAWQRAGWLPPREGGDRSFSKQSLAQEIRARRSGTPGPLAVDELALDDLETKLKAGRTEAIRETLDDCRRRGWLPLQTLGRWIAGCGGGPPEAQPDTRVAKLGGEDRVSEGYLRNWQEPGPTGDAAEPIPEEDALVLDAWALEALLRKDVSRDLVGLALSGGGIRSASFNLGLIQALQRHGFLRDLDYLSTVSGGGYVGSLLSSLVHKRDVHLDPARGKTLPLAPDVNGKQPERAVKLVRSGSFLNNPSLHTSRYLLGLLLNNLVLLSAVIALCTAVALLWRVLDMSPVADWLMDVTGRYVREWNRPFLPGVLLLLLWFVISATYLALFGPRGQPRMAWRLLQVAGGCFIIGLAVWLATPNILFPILELKSSAASPGLLSLGNTPLVILLVLAVVGLLPFLRPKSFMASGTHPGSNKAERLAFRTLSLALLAGIPFFIVYLLARHDLAAAFDPTYDIRERDKDVSVRRAKLHSTDIHYERWDGFWKRFLKQKDEPHSFSQEIWQRLDPQQREAIVESIRPDGTVLASIKRTPFPRDPAVKDLKEGIIKAINREVIEDAGFADAVLARPPQEVQEATWAYVHKRAGQLREGERLQSLLDRYLQKRVIKEEAQELNRLLLEAYYGGALWERAVVRRHVVVERDQLFRLWILGIASGLALVASMLVGLNATSLQGIYRNQLAHVYLEPVGEPKPDIPLHELDTTGKGAPYHLISGALDKGACQNDDARPTGHFLFSPRYCGSILTGFVATERYLRGRLDLATAMAISGAAFSPTRVRDRFIAFLMIVLNLRLGQWLPSPRYPDGARRLPLFWLGVSLLWHRGAARRRYWFVTDGGHSENLGLGPLLRRECQLIVVSDAGHDPDYGFDDFVQLYRHARIKGIRFQTLDQSGFVRMDPLVPDKATGNSPHRYVIARIEYPGLEKKEGLLIYIKPSFFGDEGIDLARYRKRNAAFPHDPTANQWFDQDQVESYRELGAWIGERACQSLSDAFRLHRERAGLEQLVARVQEVATVQETSMLRQVARIQEVAHAQVAKVLEIATGEPSDEIAPIESVALPPDELVRVPGDG